jgi:osmotically-inducible protein OsmY
MTKLRFQSIGARRATLAGALCAALATLACGDDEKAAHPPAVGAPEAAAPAAVSEAVGAAEAALEEAKREVAARKEAVSAAEQALAEAEKRAAAAAEGVTTAKQAAELGSDAALFRAVQSRLLEDEGLKAVAVSATVHDGQVKLSGRVPDAALRDRALAVARETPGVRAVESEIEVAD